MKLTYAVLVLALLPFAASADPVEVTLTTRILGVKDAKTGQNYVLRGNKARAYAKVSLHAKGPAKRGLRQWLEKRPPATLTAYFEREDKDTRLSIRFKPVPFRLKNAPIVCTPGSSGAVEICHADYAVSSVNAVDLPGGEGGEHTVTLQLLPGPNPLKVKETKAAPFTYHVLNGDPKLSRYGAAGGGMLRDH